MRKFIWFLVLIIWAGCGGLQKVDTSPPKRELTNTTFSSPFSHTYIQFLEGIRSRSGESSYHFIAEDNVYINWKHAVENGWRSNSGNFLPEKKLFTNTSFNKIGMVASNINGKPLPS